MFSHHQSLIPYTFGTPNMIYGIAYGRKTTPQCFIKHLIAAATEANFYRLFTRATRAVKAA